LQFP